MRDDRELRAAAFETILFFPGQTFESWKKILLLEYTSEVVEALGSNPEDVQDGLAELWESVYEDESTGIAKKYCEWAVLLKNQSMVDYYRKLVEEANPFPERPR